jgi:hypothetical protein
MEKKYPVGIESNNSKHQDIILKVCKAHGIKPLELTTKHIALMSDCISEYIAQQPTPTGAVFPTKELTPEQLAVMNKTSSRLFVRDKPTGAIWVKASDQLPGWRTPVRWRHESGGEVPAKQTVSAMINSTPVSLHEYEWLDESGGE